jgi:DNA-binding transcriptional MerR regulator/effector-binding domain-containing protein
LREAVSWFDVVLTTGGSCGLLRRQEDLMYSIGDFSKITGLTVKTLRFYHEQGLLIPSAVDDKSGYRYYDRSKIETARVITHLKSLDLTVDEIGAILRDSNDDADLRDVMERQKALLEAKIKRYRTIVRSVNQFLAAEEETRKLMTKSTFQIEEKTVEPLLIAGIRMKGRYADSGAGFSRIGKSLGRYICGKPMLLQYDAEFRQDDADFEACMPVRTDKQVDGISIRRIPGGRCVSCLHQGPYNQMGRSYAKILDYIRGKGYAVQMPTREIYLKGPGMIFAGNPRNYLTEIQILVEDSASARGGKPSKS